MRTRVGLFSATLATSIVLAAGSGAYALGGPGGSGGHGYPTHPPLHGPGSSHNPIVKRPPVHGPGSSHNPVVKRSVHGPGSSHNPIVVRRRGRY
jgi:hypothetical protein